MVGGVDQATGDVPGIVPNATPLDADRALAAAKIGFAARRNTGRGSAPTNCDE